MPRMLKMVLMIAMVFAAWMDVVQAQGVDLEAVNLQPQFVEGRVTRYELWTQWSQVTSSDRGGGSVSYVLDGEATWEVEKVKADGSAVCALTLDWLTMAFTGPDGTVMNMDSRKSKGDYPSVQKRLQAMTNTPVRYNVSADGVMQSVSGVKVINKKLDEQSDVFEDIDFLESGTTMATLPGAPGNLAVGKSWKMNYDWSHDLTGIAGVLSHDMKYTLDSVEEIAGIPVATVTESSKMKYTPDLSEIPKDGPDVSLKMTRSSLDSQVMFDLQRHEAVGRNSVESRTFKFTVSFRGRSIVTTIDETVHSQMLRLSEE